MAIMVIYIHIQYLYIYSVYIYSIYIQCVYIYIHRVYIYTFSLMILPVKEPEPFIFAYRLPKKNGLSFAQLKISHETGFPLFWRHTHVVVKHNSDINPKLSFPCVQCTWVCLLKYTCYYYNVLVNHNVPHKKITRIGGLPYFQTSPHGTALHIC